LDLESIAGSLPGVQYRPDTFPGLVYRLRKPKATTLIFRSGKMVCAGAKREEDANQAVIKLRQTLGSKGLIGHG
jgi:transcription initiation factor TFIID TATA-box-binding protein